jgi:hypothetical protein
MTTTQRQIDHLKAHKALFDEAYGLPGEGRDIDEYIDEYDDGDHPDLYVNICSDLGIEPLPPEQHGFNIVLSKDEFDLLMAELDKPARAIPELWKLQDLLKGESPWPT